MNPLLFRFPLFDKEPAASGGDGPTTPAVTDPAPVDKTENPENPETPAEPTTLQKIKALGQDKGKMLADRDSAVLRADAAEAELATLKASHEALQTENAALKQEQAAINEALQSSEAKNTTVSDKAEEKIAELGIAPDTLPAANAQSDETLETIQAKIAVATCPKEKGKLAAQAKKLRWA